MVEGEQAGDTFEAFWTSLILWLYFDKIIQSKLLAFHILLQRETIPAADSFKCLDLILEWE